jgi:hypothetical protein
MKTKLFPLMAIFVILSIGCISQEGKIENQVEPGSKIIIYKSASCNCCNQYIDYLKENGFQVETINSQDMVSIKNNYNIPQEMQSCHTAVIGDYFIEGHVPLEAVNKLLTEKPSVDGIALPGMPSGSPGMPGVKSGSFTIYSLSGGRASVFLKL